MNKGRFLSVAGTVMSYIKYKRANQMAGIGPKRAKLMHKTAFLRVHD